MQTKASHETGLIPDFLYLQSPSLHAVIFIGTLSEAIQIRPPANEESAGSFSQPTVQEIWEKKFRELSDENPELTITGIILFYPTYVLSYCEVIYSSSSNHRYI